MGKIQKEILCLLKESQSDVRGSFSSQEFESKIPHEMRWKMWDVITDNSGNTCLYWVTQQYYSKEQLEQFKKVLSDLYGDVFDCAFVIVRDDSTYDFNEDSASGRGDFITLGGSVNESVLTEKINKDNIEINDKIRKSLRSKSVARANEPEFAKHGIKVSYDQSQGTTLVGPNGKNLYDDRNNVYGPTKPGFSNTHRKHDDLDDRILKNAQDGLRDAQIELKQLEVLDKDDIIRKYHDMSTDEALAKHQKDIENAKENIEYYEDRVESYAKRADDTLKSEKNARRSGHTNGLSYSSQEISKTPNYREDKSTADKVDYLNYLTKKDTGYRDDSRFSNRKKFNPADTMNKRLNKYKELKGNEDRAKSDLDFDKRYYGVKSDEDLKKQAEEIRAKAEKDIEDARKQNDENKSNISKSEERLKTAQQNIKDYMAQVRNERNNKNKTN